MPAPDTVARALSRPLRLAVDARDLVRDERGIGSYVRALLARFARRDDVELTLLVRGMFPRLAARRFRAAIGAGPATRLRFANRVPSQVDAVWHPWNGLFFAGSPRSVATLHDVVPFAFPAADAARRVSQQTPIRRTAERAAAILCDSHFTRDEVRRLLDVEAERLHVVELGVDSAFAPGDLGRLPALLRGRPYILHVGAHDPHKNVTTLGHAHRMAFSGSETALVFTKPDPRFPEALVFECVEQPVLTALYRSAAVVAVPSVYEGFGLPVLEAMACGAPVLASRAASLPEVGGDAARYIDEPTDVAAWCAGLRALCADPEARARMGAAGVLRAAEFSWERCAARTLDVLRSAAGPGA